MSKQSEKEDLFTKADQLLFKESNHVEAQKIYLQILALNENDIEAINSIAYCIKFSAQKSGITKSVYEELILVYQRSLSIDSFDVEANFNIGLLYFQFDDDLQSALKHFLQSVAKINESSRKVELFRPQFAKAYYNIGMIQERLGKLQESAESYQKVLDLCDSMQSQTYMKAATNLAVMLEKLGKRSEALKLLEELKEKFSNEVRVLNNLGILQKRIGEVELAVQSYQNALEKDPKSFFPNYNLAVLLATEGQYKQAVSFFKQALEITQADQNAPFELNVILNLALCFEQLKQFNFAIDFLEVGLTLQPSNELIKNKINTLKSLEHSSKNISHGINQAKLRDDLEKNALSSASNSLRTSQQSSRLQSQQSNRVHQENPNEVYDDQLNEETQIIVHEKFDDEFEWSKWDLQKSIQEVQSNNPEKQIRGLYRLGEISLLQGDFEESMKHFSQVKHLNREFQSLNVNYYLADLLYRLNRVEEALNMIKEMQAKDQVNVLILQGQCYDKLQMFEQAVEIYDRALELSTDSELIGNLLFKIGCCRIKGKKQIELGITNLELAAKTLPSNIEILLKLASVIYKEVPYSSETARKILEITDCITQLNFTNSSEALILKVKVLIREQDFKQAIKTIEQLTTLSTLSESTQASNYYLMGICHEKLNDANSSLQSYKKCLTIDSNHFGSCLNLGNLLLKMKQYERALKYLEHALKIDPTNINAQLSIAETLQESNQHTQALTYYEKLIETDPENFVVLNGMGISYLRLEQYHEAAKFIKKALQINKQYTQALISMGNLLFETGSAEQSLKYFNQALKINSNEINAIIGLADAYYDLKKIEKAIEMYEKVLQIKNDLPDIHYSLGNALYLQENVERAIQHYRHSIQLNPDKAEVYYNLGNALCVKGQYDEACQAYQETINLDSDNPSVYYNLGNSLYMMNKFQEAVKQFRISLQLNEANAEVNFNIASAYNDLADYSAAIRHYQRSIELDENNLESYLCLGAVYLQTSLGEKAKSIFEQGLKKNPNDQRFISALKKLIE